MADTAENPAKPASAAPARRPRSLPRVLAGAAFGVMALSALLATVIFFLSVQGAEQTLVPNVERKPLVSALLELQVKELYPRLQLRYSGSPVGTILEQDPPAGTIVKAGRRIRLVVSQGAVVSAVEDYIGRPLDEVRLDLQTLFAVSGAGLDSAAAFVILKEPVMYEYSAFAPGTIVQQSPPAGTPVSGRVELQFVVSRGSEPPAISMPDLSGFSAQQALDLLSAAAARVSFTIRPAEGTEKGETVVEQYPAAGVRLSAGEAVNVTVAAPRKPGEGEVYALFTYTLPENPYPLPLTLEAVSEDGKRLTLARTNHAGGEFSFPCRQSEGTHLVLSLLGREIYRVKAAEAW